MQTQPALDLFYENSIMANDCAIVSRFARTKVKQKQTSHHAKLTPIATNKSEENPMPIVNLEKQEISVDRDDAPILNAINDFLGLNDWNDIVTFDQETGESKLAFNVGINDQRYQFFVEGDEADETVAVFAYTPFSVPVSRMADVCRLLNSINMMIGIGRLAVFDNDEPNSIQFKIKYDVTDGACSGRMIDIAVDTAIGVYKNYQQPIAQVIFANKSAKESWQEYLKSSSEEN